MVNLPLCICLVYGSKW